MLILLRIVFGAALAFVLGLAIRAADQGWHGDITPAFYLALCVLVGIANAVVWAPWIGDKIAGPLSGFYAGEGAPVKPNLWLRLARRFETRQHRRLALALAFLEGVRHPDAPGAFLIGLRNARPGSWLEKIFAREVYRFDNIQNAIQARRVLQQHGEEPPPHPNQQVCAVLLSLEREHQPEPAILTVPAAEPPTIARNPRIRLFSAAAPPPVPEPPASDPPPSGS